MARIEFYEPGSCRFHGQNEDTAELMRQIGLTVVGSDDSVNNDESFERLPDIDADWLVIPIGTDPIPRSRYEELSATRCSGRSPPVRADRVHLAASA